jgi:hypothetical protein
MPATITMANAVEALRSGEVRAALTALVLDAAQGVALPLFSETIRLGMDGRRQCLAGALRDVALRLHTKANVLEREVES